MINKKIAETFFEISQYLSLENSYFESQAYEKAAKAILSLDIDIYNIYKSKGVLGLQEIPGIGKTLAKRVEEYIKTNKIKKLEELKDKYPLNINELLLIEGIGPKMARILYEKLGIKNIKDLEEAIKAHKLRNISGFGEKTEKNILKAIIFSKKSKGRFLLAEIEPLVAKLKEKIESLKGVKKVAIAGSFRRCKETVGDIDILVQADSAKETLTFFEKSNLVKTIYGKGKTKISLRLNNGIDVDIRIVDVNSFGSGFQYFTGNKDHNIALRLFAERELGLKINEYGVFKNNKNIAGRTEKDVYHALGMEVPPPEIRTNDGEIEAALNNSLPTLVKEKDILGDLHMHTLWSDGMFSIKRMAQAAKKMGYQYISITDHTGNLKIANSLNEKRVLEQILEIKRINKEIKGIKIFTGAEVNIKQNGSIDMEENVLSKLDWVVASIHSGFKMPKEKMTKRIIKAMENPYVRAIGHPTGRIIKEREGYELDWQKIFKIAKETGTFLEINSFPNRLDINNVVVRNALKFGLKIVINTDAHHIDHLKFMKYGVCQARRGWAEKKDILNTLSLSEFEKVISKKIPF